MVDPLSGDQRHPLLQTRTVVWRWVFIATASLWSLGFAIFIFSYHIDKPHGVLTITTGGRTFAGKWQQPRAASEAPSPAYGGTPRYACETARRWTHLAVIARDGSG